MDCRVALEGIVSLGPSTATKVDRYNHAEQTRRTALHYGQQHRNDLDYTRMVHNDGQIRFFPLKWHS